MFYFFCFILYGFLSVVRFFIDYNKLGDRDDNSIWYLGFYVKIKGEIVVFFI